jgi:tartrate-resistant acid phosphatase type 5
VVVPGQTTPLAKDKTYHQLAVAQAMGQYAVTSTLKPSFVIALGDNFYANGVSSSTDVLWSYLWKNVYLQEYNDLYIPWYPVFGNHDYGGSTDAQIQRFLDHSDDDIWMFESSYYLKTFEIPGGGSVAILFIDTTTLAPSENKCCNSKG